MSWHELFRMLPGLPGAFSSFMWLLPSALLIFSLVPFFLDRSWKGRETEAHGEPWVFSPDATGKTGFFVFRMFGLVFVGASAAAFIFAVAHPVLVKEEVEHVGAPVRIYNVVDTSGSIQCSQYARYLQFFDGLTATPTKPPIAIGPYFFSSQNLVHVYPNTNYARSRRILVRFGPHCGMQTIGGGGGWMGGYQAMVSTMDVYGTGSGTEPGPSLYEALTDALRFSDPELVSFVRLIQDQRGFDASAAPLENFLASYSRMHVLERLRKAVQGERILFFTDTQFSPTSGEIATSRVVALAKLIGIPIDLVASLDSGDTLQTDVKKIIGETGGESFTLAIYTPESVIHGMAERYRAVALKGMPQQKEIRDQTLDDTPRSLFILAALLGFAVWAVIRLSYPIIDY